MKFSRAIITSLLTASSHRVVSAFTATGSVGRPAFVGSSGNAVRSFQSSSALSMANVPKLTDPIENLLAGTDVFIFDCDGVIWRVSTALHLCA